jgi:pre-mRNA cleavage complex 2 protein Pcf11
MSSSHSSIIVEDYGQSLNDLTFNSRPIIDNLTTIAKENPDVADGIIDAITNRIYKCIPEHKLFALYLLDSVCKNVGTPYNILVGDDIFLIYSHVFQLVTETIRQTKLIALFETWKTTKTKGSTLPLFPREQTDKIDAFLSKAGYSKKRSDNRSDLSNKILIEDINTLIPIFKKKLKNGGSSKLQDRFNALNQLKVLLSSQPMKQNDLLAVQAQLNTIKEQELNQTPILTPTNTPAPTTPSNAPLANKAQAIFQVLINAGIVTAEQAPIPGSQPEYKLVFPKIKYMPSDMPSNSTLQDILDSSSNIHRLEYEKLKYTEMVIVSRQTVGSLKDFINTNTPSEEALALLYNGKGSKCSQCGKRFATDSVGASKKRLHLDWHFRVNKKLSNANASVQSRNWYMDDYDWANFKDENLLEFATTDSAEIEKNKVDVAAGLGKVPYVQVPSSETNMNNRCTICREFIKATYNDEIGEWCWMNCVPAPGEGKITRKIIHAACFHESSNKRGAEGDLNQRVKREKTV